KASTTTEYTRRINKALEFIHQNLDQTIRLDDIAGASYFSSFHFHRIFHALVGETVNDYVSRKRMEKAISRLVRKPELSITDVAVIGGFSSSANFSRAFKLYFGISPTDLRNGQSNTKNSSKIGKLFSKYGKAFNPQNLYPQFLTQTFVFDPEKLEEMLMKVKVEEQQEKTIAYLTAPKGYELDSIFATWDKIIHWATNQGIEDDRQERFAICYDNPSITPEEKCRYEAAIVVRPNMEINSPYTKSVIPAGKYAVAYYKDDAEKINNFITELCSHWFPDSGYEPDDYPIRFNYLNDSRQDGFVEMKVYIKLKELSIG
ncbi:MAG: GyrI-like domain-containing protein, partial [Gammaproteobacteria bacterium]|nr:GyrI-like domain-containing protein [Gammaproteobacteria bacterium]